MFHPPKAQLSAAALRRPSKLRQMVSLSRWLCSLTPSAPRMKARPLELPAMRPVSGVDSTSIRFFHTPVRMKRENTAPEKHTRGVSVKEDADDTFYTTYSISFCISSVKIYTHTHAYKNSITGIMGDSAVVTMAILAILCPPEGCRRSSGGPLVIYSISLCFCPLLLFFSNLIPLIWSFSVQLQDRTRGLTNVSLYFFQRFIFLRHVITSSNWHFRYFFQSDDLIGHNLNWHFSLSTKT